MTVPVIHISVSVHIKTIKMWRMNKYPAKRFKFHFTRQEHKPDANPHKPLYCSRYMTFFLPSVKMACFYDMLHMHLKCNFHSLTRPPSAMQTEQIPIKAKSWSLAVRYTLIMNITCGSLSELSLARSRVIKAYKVGKVEMMPSVQLVCQLASWGCSVPQSPPDKWWTFACLSAWQLQAKG